MEDGTKKRSSQTYTKILTHNYSNTLIPIPVDENTMDRCNLHREMRHFD